MAYEDKYENMRNELADKAVGEMVKVAEEFARQINQRYHRVHTIVCSTSAIDGHDESYTLLNPLTLKLEHVKLDVSKLWWSDSVELAWELEGKWNEACDWLTDRQDVIDTYYDYDHDAWERYYDMWMRVRDEKLNEMCRIIERWIDGTECFVWQLEDDELEEEHACSVAA